MNDPRNGRDDHQLQLTEEQLRLAEETVGIGGFEIDLTNGRWVTTPHVAVLFGIGPRSGNYSDTEWEKPIFIDDRHKLRTAITKSQQNGDLNVEFRVTHPDGSVHWLILKGDTARDASGKIRWVRGTCLDITERKVLEVRLLAVSEMLEARVRERTRELEVSFAQLQESERRFRLLVEGVTDYAIFMLDPSGTVVQWNPGAERLKGYTSAEIVGLNFSRFYTEEDLAEGIPGRLLQQAAIAGKIEAEGWRVRKDGSRFWANVVIHAVRDAEGQLLGYAKVTRDLTERRAAEAQVRQAQKMEAIGHLTGGIAHDFNNLLTVISGCLETLQRRLPTSVGEDLRRHIIMALHGATRASQLTHQLLAFSRRQALDPKLISINELISHMSELLRRTLPESIAIEIVLAGGVWDTFADANQLENCLLNLAVNARDAMPGGGRLTIEAANVFLDDDYAASAEVPSGQYVGLFVSDTGIGMTPEIIAQAFDPFFTTKEVGEGTGLGLSQVYGFVKQSGGHVKIYSEAGSGTTVKIYLPRFHSGPAIEKPRQLATDAPRGMGETILVTEDEPGVREFAIGLLRELGYTVLETSDAAEALRLLQSHHEISLLFTDVGLPGGMNGRQLADEARRRRPGLKVLFTSGYARNAIVHHGRLDPGVQLLPKPFTFVSLATKLRQVLDSP